MYELKSTSIQESDEKQVYMIDDIEDVFKHVKQLFEEGYKVLKIKNLDKDSKINEDINNILSN